MFTEYELASIVEIPTVKEANFELKKDFVKNEAPYLDLSDHDFFSLVMMSPMVHKALADESISLMEELKLNKMARKLSKGGYFFQKDPVVDAMKFLIKSFDKWSDKFYGLLRLAMTESFNYEGIEKEKFDHEKEVTYEAYKREVLRQPYILIRFIASFFLKDDEEIISEKRSIPKDEYDVMVTVGQRVGLDELPVFQMFCKTFEIKS